MEKIYTTVSQLVGKTPLLRVCNIEKEYGLKAQIAVKLECFNPAGSAKDRVAVNVIDDAEQRGVLKPGGMVIEPTSGNTGIGLSAVAAARGYKAVIVMPDTMSVERRLLMAAYGAEVVLSPGAEGMSGAIKMAEEISKQNPGSFIAGQFENKANSEAHYKTTGPEIWDDTCGKVDIFVAGVGTGGTVTGVGKYLKEKNSNVQIVAVEPEGSPLLSQGRAGAHGIQGIGANFVPAVLDTEVYNEIITVSNDNAYLFAREMAKKEGMLVGISSGAALYAATELAKRAENEGKLIVALMPDTGERYLSTPLFSE